MRLLASRFTAARQMLDRVEALLSAQERVPVQQLRSLFGGTLAAARYGLGDFRNWGSSPLMSLTGRRMPGLSWGS